MKPTLTRLADAKQLSSYVYDTSSERKVLLTALHLVKPDHGWLVQQETGIPDPIDYDRPAPTPDPNSDRKKKLSETWKVTKQKIDYAYDRSDVDGLYKIRDSAIKARQARDAELALSNTAPETYGTDYDERLQTQTKKLASAAAGKLKASPNDVLLGFVGVSLQQWQAKKVQELNRRIDQLALREPARYDGSGATGSVPDAADVELRRLYRMKATVLGQGKTYDQIVALQRIRPEDPKGFEAAQQTIGILEKKTG
jgi:hypothetical protein